MTKKTSQEILLSENQCREYTDAVIVYFNKTLKDLDDLHNLSVQFWDLFVDEESAWNDGAQSDRRKSSYVEWFQSFQFNMFKLRLILELLNSRIFIAVWFELCCVSMMKYGF